MSSDPPSPDTLPLNIPEQDAILFGVTELKVVYFDTRREQLLFGTYDETTDRLDVTLTFDTSGIGDALNQFMNLPSDVQPSIIAEAFSEADADEYEHPYIAALIEVGFSAEDVKAILPISERLANSVASAVHGEAVEE